MGHGQETNRTSPTKIRTRLEPLAMLSCLYELKFYCIIDVRTVSTSA